jgi:hypothetical protein
MYEITSIDIKTQTILEKIKRDDFTSACIYCMINDRHGVKCLMRIVNTKSN